MYRLGKPAAARWAPDLSFKFGPDGRYQTSRELGLPRVTQLDGGAPIVGTAIALALQYAMLEVAPMSVEKLGNRIIVVVAGRVFWGCGRLAVFIDADTGRVVDEQPTSYIDGGYATDCAAFWEWRTPFIADPPPPTTIDL